MFFSRPAGRHSLREAGDRQSDAGLGVGARAVGMAVGTGGKSRLKPLPTSGDHRRGVVVIDHMTVGGGVWAAAGR